MGVEIFLLLFFFTTVFINLPMLQSQAVWDSMPFSKIAIFVLLSLSTIITLSYSIPAGFCRRLLPWLGQVYVPFAITSLFWSVEVSLWIWSVRFYSDTINGHLSFISWFFYGFTPILSVSCLGGGFGAVMIAFTFPAWIAGCSALGIAYYYLAAAGQGYLCVVGSCALKVGLLLFAPRMGFLGGHVLSNSEL